MPPKKRTQQLKYARTMRNQNVDVDEVEPNEDLVMQTNNSNQYDFNLTGYDKEDDEYAISLLIDHFFYLTNNKRSISMFLYLILK